ncbi:unnamed protein product [Mesocestoides corti]|uniref:Uncharacterized protein n=1 Tax=Mesocestoides corti TaxID=53468 RepID=A0A0R3UB26_MESCO|nr:unnamed protein product [Mesocestoides corti]
MLLENLLCPPTHSFVGRDDQLPQWAASHAEASPQVGQPQSGTGSASASTSPPEAPLDALASAVRTIRLRLQTTTQTANTAAAANPLPSDFDISLFVSRREYENGRVLLMRNARAIPSLCRLVAASNLLPAIATVTVNATTQTQVATTDRANRHR